MLTSHTEVVGTECVSLVELQKAVISFVPMLEIWRNILGRMYTEIGVKPGYIDILVASISSSENFIPPNSIRIQPPSIDLFPAIVQYHSNVNGFFRQTFLKEWTFVPNCHTSVALEKWWVILLYAQL